MTTNDDLEQRFIKEMEALIRNHAPGVEIVFTPQNAYTLIGLIQLACRHPGCTGYPREVAERLVPMLASCFDPQSVIAETIRRGWNDR